MIRVRYRRGASLDAIAAEHGLPAGSVRLVARPSRWGNPHVVRGTGRTNREVVRLFEGDVRRMIEREGTTAVRQWLAPLRGARALACYCPADEPCHADVLIQLLEDTA